ncbi:hypothetical protein EVG20_g9828, partial [Dentipellis fragilis]
RAKHQCIVLEGGLVSDMQLVEDVQAATGITLSSDGITHRSSNYESREALVIRADGRRVRYFLGVHSAPSHTSEAQEAGWHEVINSKYETFNESPRAAEQKADSCIFVIKTTGFHTDHAEDQKRLVRVWVAHKRQMKHEVRGEQALKFMASDKVLMVAWEASRESIEAVGGIQEWERMGTANKEAHLKIAYQNVMVKLGKDAFTALSDVEKADIDFFVWTGCCMHKELNAVKGGNVRMMAWWVESKVEGPIKLMNRDNARTVTLTGSSSASAQALDVLQGGAVKVTSLAGTIFNNKDDKKGHQNILRWHLFEDHGFTINFPDTSNTRYQSHCEAATELLIDLNFYIEFLELVKDKKEKQSLNHMEQNVYNALHDIPTLHELATLTLYSQSISHPYLRQVHGSAAKDRNALDLGPLHDRVIQHCQAIISNPDLLLAPAATYHHGSLDAQPWECPDAFYAIHRLLPNLPHLRGTLVAFFEGALETWKWFSAEFSSSGPIVALSKEARSCTWMEPTNDKNEGNLGAYHVNQRKNLSITQHQYNARVSFKRNKTSAYIKDILQPVDCRYLRRKARILDASRLEAE